MKIGAKPTSETEIMLDLTLFVGMNILIELPSESSTRIVGRQV